MSHQKHPRGSPGFRGQDDSADQPPPLPILRRRKPHDDDADNGQDRWQDDGGESGESVE